MQPDHSGYPQTEDMRHEIRVEEPENKFEHEIYFCPAKRLISADATIYRCFPAGHDELLGESPGVSPVPGLWRSRFSTLLILKDPRPGRKRRHCQRYRGVTATEFSFRYGALYKDADIGRPQSRGHSVLQLVNVQRRK